MIEILAPVVGVPALVAALWTAAGLRAAGSRGWVVGGAAAGVLAAVLMLVAAFSPLAGILGALGIPALCVAGGALLLLLFSRLHAVAVALSVPFAFAIVLNPAVFPLVMPLILVLPIWVAGWLERERGAGLYALTLLVAFVVVPAVIYGTWFVVRGG